MELVVALTIGTLFASGTFMILRPRGFSVVQGLILLSHGINILLVAMGRVRLGSVPIMATEPVQPADPLAQALVLTAIVISFGTTAFLLVLAYRSYQQAKTEAVNLDVGARSSMNAASLVVIPVLWPMLTAVALLVANDRRWQRGLSVASLVGLLAIDIWLGVAVFGGEILVHRLGDWPAPFGIVLVADRLAVTMLLLAALTGLAVVLYDVAEPDRVLRRLPFYPLFHFLMMGLNGAFVTGDLFNLFVFFEILLIASYALATLGASEPQLRAGFQFVVLNLVSSALFLFGVGVLYGLTGTLNMADLALKVPEVAASDLRLLRVAMMTLLVVFSTKAALLPLAFWLPDTYPTPPAPIAAMFGGIATKVGVYALLRVFTTVFAEVRGPAAEVLIFLGTISMLVGVLGAVAQTDIRRLLSFHIISQIGYLVFGLALFSVAGVGAAIFYMVHYTIVKCALFLLAGLAERLGGSRNLKQLRGLASASPALATLFFVAGISLAGLPPSSGFLSKYLVLSAGITQGRYVGVTIGFLTGLLTLLSMMKIWTMAFWGGEPERATSRLSRGQLAATALLVSFSLSLAVAAQPLYGLARATAEQTLDTAGYVAAVGPVSAPGVAPPVTARLTSPFGLSGRFRAAASRRPGGLSFETAAQKRPPQDERYGGFR